MSKNIIVSDDNGNIIIQGSNNSKITINGETYINGKKIELTEEEKLSIQKKDLEDRINELQKEIKLKSKRCSDLVGQLRSIS